MRSSNSIKVYQRVYQFCIVDLSSFYLDVLKDRLYAESPRQSLTAAAAHSIVLARIARRPGPPAGADPSSHRRGTLGRPPRAIAGEARASTWPTGPRPIPRWDDTARDKPLGPAQAAQGRGAGRPRRYAEAEVDRVEPGGGMLTGSAPTPKPPPGSTAAFWPRSATSPRSMSSPTATARSRPARSTSSPRSHRTVNANGAGIIERRSARKPGIRACASGAFEFYLDQHVGWVECNEPHHPIFWWGSLHSTHPTLG